jgi:uncharacterized protein (DUF2267 family)
MEYSEFLQITQSEAGGDAEEAERAARAVLTTLGERLPRENADDLITRLPDEIRPWLRTERSAERFAVAEFLRRVAEREGVDTESAERDVRAVAAALREAVGNERYAGLMARLPPDYTTLLPSP